MVGVERAEVKLCLYNGLVELTEYCHRLTDRQTSSLPIRGLLKQHPQLNISNREAPEPWESPSSAAMKSRALFFCLLLACFCLSLAQGSYENCCLSYVKSVKPSVKKAVRSYRMQETDGGCNIQAIVFKMRKGKVFCANPETSWVQMLMKKLDAKNNKAENPKKSD
ncbi:C-C motif chemokine 25-like [Acipenser ruthenus]|uniref:C-C motif chemokine 25-like n=2 Tax=Acipenser ruthenus TaxID=7906 RepID=UPI0027409650|nr:C-C motif chemokine 25-like [Acipenser ruthenus]